MLGKISKIFKKIKKGWIRFWGKKYWIYKEEKEIGEIIFYKHKIYIQKDKEDYNV